MREFYRPALGYVLRTVRLAALPDRMVTVAVDETRMARMRREPIGGPLTKREVEMLALGAEGLTYKEIAYVASISRWTVKTHMKHVMAKLGVNTT